MLSITIINTYERTLVHIYRMMADYTTLPIRKMQVETIEMKKNWQKRGENETNSDREWKQIIPIKSSKCLFASLRSALWIWILIRTIYADHSQRWMNSLSFRILHQNKKWKRTVRVKNVKRYLVETTESLFSPSKRNELNIVCKYVTSCWWVFFGWK